MVIKTGCCPPFDPIPWEEQEIKWKNKKFIKDSVMTLIYIPLNFGAVITRNMKKIEQCKAKNPQNIMLSEHNSMFKTTVYIAVDKEIPQTEITTLSGTFLTKTFEGPYKNAGIWAKEMDTYVASEGKTIKKLYYWYTTCPKCAKVYGKNYTVLFAEV
ncbi:MAG: hydrolase [Candidatus Woesearchaeota archaeon]|jgi:hypothetical protein